MVEPAHMPATSAQRARPHRGQLQSRRKDRGAGRRRNSGRRRGCRPAAGAASTWCRTPGHPRLQFGQTCRKVSADVDGQLGFLDVELSVRWPAPIAQVTEAVRQHLSDESANWSGSTFAKSTSASSTSSATTPPARVS